MEQQKQYTRCLIVGSGPAGYTAAIYAARANLNPVLYCGLQTGGQLTQTTEVENFPGYPEGVDGNQMMMDLRQQAERYGTDIRDGEIVKADLTKAPYKLVTDSGDELQAETVIIATGASAKYLGLDDEEKYKGQGVSACATCDGFFYRGKVVAVVGGGDTACEEATYLAGLCSKVYLIVRKDYLRASEVMQQRVEENEKIEILYKHNATGLYGENGVEGVHARVRALHGSHHLYAAQRVHAQIARQARGDQLHHGIDRRAHALPALEEKVRVPRAHFGIFAAVDAMGVAHDHARCGLAEDLGERHRGHRAAFEHVL